MKADNHRATATIKVKKNRPSKQRVVVGGQKRKKKLLAEVLSEDLAKSPSMVELTQQAMATPRPVATSPAAVSREFLPVKTRLPTGRISASPPSRHDDWANAPATVDVEGEMLTTPRPSYVLAQGQDGARIPVGLTSPSQMEQEPQPQQGQQNIDQLADPHQQMHEALRLLQYVSQALFPNHEGRQNDFVSQVAANMDGLFEDGRNPFEIPMLIEASNIIDTAFALGLPTPASNNREWIQIVTYIMRHMATSREVMEKIIGMAMVSTREVTPLLAVSWYVLIIYLEAVGSSVQWIYRREEAMRNAG